MGRTSGNVHCLVFFLEGKMANMCDYVIDPWAVIHLAEWLRTLKEHDWKISGKDTRGTNILIDFSK